jgi:Na+/H+ antiporter NhaD/arsenite permease-like protein
VWLPRCSAGRSATADGLVLPAASQLDAEDIARGVEWPTLIFFAGLFVMAGALVHSGVIETVSDAITHATEGSLLRVWQGNGVTSFSSVKRAPGPAVGCR